jgi:hypothetical protein
MTQNTETSVMFALAELQRSELARQAEELARQAQLQKEREDKERREREQAREAELQAQRVAEAAARLRIEVEAREAAARERVAAMQQALIQIKAERDVLHEHLHTQPPPAPASGAALRWAMSGMALSLLAVVGMAVVLLTQPVRARGREPLVGRPAVPSGLSQVPVPPPPAAPPPAAPLPAAAPHLVTVSRPPTGAAHTKPGPRPAGPRPASLPAVNPEDCGDDPICGMKFK